MYNTHILLLDLTYRRTMLPVTQPPLSQYWRELSTLTPNHWQSPAGLVLSWSSTGLLRKEVSLPLCQLSLVWHERRCMWREWMIGDFVCSCDVWYCCDGDIVSHATHRRWMIGDFVCSCDVWYCCNGDGVSHATHWRWMIGDFVCSCDVWYCCDGDSVSHATHWRWMIGDFVCSCDVWYCCNGDSVSHATHRQWMIGDFMCSCDVWYCCDGDGVSHTTHWRPCTAGELCIFCVCLVGRKHSLANRDSCPTLAKSEGIEYNVGPGAVSG